MKLRFGIFPRLLAALIVVAVVPMSVVWHLHYRSSMTALTQQIEQQLSDRADAIAAYADQFVDAHLRMLRGIASIEDVRSMDGRRQTPVLKAFAAQLPWLFLVHTVGPDGVNVARSDGKPMMDFHDRLWFQQVMAGAPFGQQVVIARTTGEPAFILSVPIYAGERRAGSLQFSAAITDLTNRVTNVKFGETGYAFLLDDKGEIMAHPKARGSFKNHPVFIALAGKTSGLAGESRARSEDSPAAETAAPAGETKTTEQLDFIDPGSGKRVIAIAQKTRYGWTMVTQQNYDEVYRPVAEANLRAAIMLAVVIVAVVGFSYLLAQGFARPIVRFARIADDISRGNLSAEVPETDRSDEIGHLARAIDRLSISVRLSMERLART